MGKTDRGTRDDTVEDKGLEEQFDSFLSTPLAKVDPLTSGV